MFPELVQKEIQEKPEETYTMIDYKQEDQNTHHTGGNKNHESEEGHTHAGGNGMRCEHQ